jgi:hypothetical protein
MKNSNDAPVQSGAPGSVQDEPIGTPIFDELLREMSSQLDPPTQPVPTEPAAEAAAAPKTPATSPAGRRRKPE